MISYVIHVLAILAISKALQSYLQFTILVQSSFVPLFCVSTFAFNWTIELLLIEHLNCL